MDKWEVITATHSSSGFGVKLYHLGRAVAVDIQKSCVGTIYYLCDGGGAKVIPVEEQHHKKATAEDRMARVHAAQNNAKAFVKRQHHAFLDAVGEKKKAKHFEIPVKTKTHKKLQV